MRSTGEFRRSAPPSSTSRAPSRLAAGVSSRREHVPARNRRKFQTRLAASLPASSTRSSTPPGASATRRPVRKLGTARALSQPRPAALGARDRRLRGLMQGSRATRSQSRTADAAATRRQIRRGRFPRPAPPNGLPLRWSPRPPSRGAAPSTPRCRRADRTPRRASRSGVLRAVTPLGCPGKKGAPLAMASRRRARCGPGPCRRATADTAGGLERAQPGSRAARARAPRRPGKPAQYLHHRGAATTALAYHGEPAATWASLERPRGLATAREGRSSVPSVLAAAGAALLAAAVVRWRSPGRTRSRACATARSAKPFANPSPPGCASDR